MREAINYEKLKDSDLFDEIEILPMEKIADHGTLVFSSELFDAFITDGVIVRDKDSFVIINASYVISSKPTTWDYGLIPEDYVVSLHLVPGTLDDDDKIDEILQKMEFFNDTDMTLLQYHATFAIR